MTDTHVLDQTPATPDHAPERPAEQTLGLVAMILSLTAVVTGFNTPLAIAGLVVGIIAARRESRRAFALTGVWVGAGILVLEFLGLVGMLGAGAATLLLHVIAY
ncbi:hypothetical protein [Desertivibrio insolitus]|uniref:hypothetical protein n=1 Tax=Herbiconiux sp. SYSU D00978 TaxID=2812562 RepID=UPI001A96F7B5|nr:hypothetical protein [Herbiconiux sp. SYSU D00978]